MRSAARRWDLRVRLLRGGLGVDVLLLARRERLRPRNARFMEGGKRVEETPSGRQRVSETVAVPA